VANKPAKKKLPAKKAPAKKVAAKVKVAAPVIVARKPASIIMPATVFTLLIAAQTGLIGFISMPKPAAAAKVETKTVSAPAPVLTTPIALPPIETVKKAEVRVKKKAAARD
jgi:hypothetical protein